MTKTKVLASTKIGNFAVSIEWCKKDLWVGIYWEDEAYELWGIIDVYLCIIPCLPFHIRYMEPRKILWAPRVTPEQRPEEDE